MINLIIYINLNEFFNFRNNNFRVRLGLWSLSVNSYPYFEAYPIFTQVHGYFNKNTLQNDIAIIQIDRAIPFANYVSINSACLPTSIPAAGTRFLFIYKNFFSFSNNKKTCDESP